MSKNIIQLLPKELSLKEDIDDIKNSLAECSPFSQDLCHLNTLLCTTLKSDNVSDVDKKRCVQLVIKHSSTLQTLLKYAPEETIAFLQTNPRNKNWSDFACL